MNLCQKDGMFNGKMYLKTLESVFQQKHERSVQVVEADLHM